MAASSVACCESAVCSARTNIATDSRIGRRINSSPCPRSGNQDEFTAKSTLLKKCVLRLCRQKRYSALLTRTANNFSIPVEWGNQPTSTCSHPSKAGSIRQLNRFAAVCPVLLGNEGKGSKGESYGVRTGSALDLRNEVLLNEVLLKLIKDLE